MPLPMATMVNPVLRPVSRARLSLNICGYRGRPRHYGPCARSSSYACPRPRAIRLPHRLGAAIWAQAWAWLPASLQTLAALPDWPSRDKGADGRDGPIIGLAVRRSGREPEPCTSQTRRLGAHRLAARGRLRAAGQRAQGKRSRGWLEIATGLPSASTRSWFTGCSPRDWACRAVGLVGDHPGAGMIDRAIGDWTRSSRTFGTQSSIVFRQPRSPTRMAAMDSQLMM
jgi:hypothetical protein